MGNQPLTANNGSSSTGQSLYTRLGGIYPIAAVVDAFSNKIYDDPLVGINSPNPQLRDWHRNQHDRLPGLKWMRTLWVSAVAGGPYKYIPSVIQRQGTCPASSSSMAGGCPFALDKAHQQLHITPKEFDAVANVLQETLNEFHIPAQEQSEVMAAFTSHKMDVVSS